MQVEALSAPNWAIVGPACSGTPPMRLDRRLLSRQAFACNPWSAVSTQHRGGDDGGSARLDRHAGPLPLRAASSAPHQALESSEPYFDTCAALNPYHWAAHRRDKRRLRKRAFPCVLEQRGLPWPQSRSRRQFRQSRGPRLIPWFACPLRAARAVYPTSEVFPPSGGGRPRLPLSFSHRSPWVAA